MASGPTISFALPDVVVVSGASSGLGLSICRLLASRAVSTIGIDLAAAPKETHDLPGYHHIAGDVTEESTWETAVAKVRACNLKTLGLVTSAAILEVGTILEFTKSAIEKTLSVNVVGTALAMKALLPEMARLGGGPIVAVASVDATFAEQQLAVYAASKGAVRQLA